MFQVVPPCGGHPAKAVVQNVDVFGFKSCPRVGGIIIFGDFSDWRRQFQVVPPCGGHRVPVQVPGAGEGFKSCPRVGGIP